MKRVLASTVVFLLSSPLARAIQDIAPADAPPETVGKMWIILFGVLFVGVIIGFFYFLLRGDGKKNGK